MLIFGCYFTIRELIWQPPREFLFKRSHWRPRDTRRVKCFLTEKQVSQWLSCGQGILCGVLTRRSTQAGTEAIYPMLKGASATIGTPQCDRLAWELSIKDWNARDTFYKTLHDIQSSSHHDISWEFRPSSKMATLQSRSQIRAKTWRNNTGIYTYQAVQ
jgi:hypothetical protein